MVSKTCLLVKILAFSAFFFECAYANNWTKIAKGSNFSEYYGNVSKSGRIASIDCMRDYEKKLIKKNQKFLSKKHSLKFDCGRKKFKMVSTEYFELNMMSGNLLQRKKESSQWKKIDPSSLNELLFKKACR